MNLQRDSPLPMSVASSFSNSRQGMLASTNTILSVAEALENHGRPACVVDPVCSSPCTWIA